MPTSVRLDRARSRARVRTDGSVSRISAHEQTPLDDRVSEGGSTPSAPLDVVPLLKAYRVALRLSRHPPASLRVPPALEQVHRWLRPTFGCHYFMTQHVRRRIETLERALAARVAVGEVDDNDPAELEALAAFKSSLVPPPSRGWIVAGLLGAILLSQVLVEQLLRLADSSNADNPSRIEQALSKVSLAPDVQSIGGLGRALTSADLVELMVVVVSMACLVYLFGRPFASGYRLTQLFLSSSEPAGWLRRNSPLSRQAVRAAIPAKEARVVRAAGDGFARGIPIDAVVKGAPWIAVAYWLVANVRIREFLDPAHPVVVWVAVSAGVVGLFVLIDHRLSGTSHNVRRVVCLLLSLGGMVLAFELLVSHSDESPGYIWLGIVTVALVRLGWLMRHVRLRGQSPLFVGVPLAVIVAIGVIAPYDLFAVELLADDERAAAVHQRDLSDVPKVSRSDLQLLLVSSMSFPGGDFRTQDLHRLILRGKRFTGAHFDLADLRWTDLRSANLRKAELVGVEATNADLRHADLKGSNLRCADLRGADLREATLVGAVFNGAISDESTRWPSGFNSSGRGIVDWQQTGAATFYGYLAFCF